MKQLSIELGICGGGHLSPTLLVLLMIFKRLRSRRSYYSDVSVSIHKNKETMTNKIIRVRRWAKKSKYIDRWLGSTPAWFLFFSKVYFNISATFPALLEGTFFRQMVQILVSGRSRIKRLPRLGHGSGFILLFSHVEQYRFHRILFYRHLSETEKIAFAAS